MFLNFKILHSTLKSVVKFYFKFKGCLKMITWRFRGYHCPKQWYVCMCADVCSFVCTVKDLRFLWNNGCTSITDLLFGSVSRWPSPLINPQETQRIELKLALFSWVSFPTHALTGRQRSVFKMLAITEVNHVCMLAKYLVAHWTDLSETQNVIILWNNWLIHLTHVAHHSHLMIETYQWLFSW